MCDVNLKAVFGVDKIDMFKMNKVLGQYVVVSSYPVSNCFLTFAAGICTRMRDDVLSIPLTTEDWRLSVFFRISFMYPYKLS